MDADHVGWVAALLGSALVLAAWSARRRGGQRRGVRALLGTGAALGGGALVLLSLGEVA